MTAIIPTWFEKRDRDRFTLAFIALFYILAIYKYLTGMWMFQLAPHFFNTRFDGTTWLFMQTGLHRWLLNNQPGCVTADLLFYAMPLLYWFCYRANAMAWRVVAVIMLLVNWFYVQVYTLYPSNSIEGHVVWLLFPFVFFAGRLKSFYLLLHSMRYFFLFFMVSAASWKIFRGAVFNADQMSAILLLQHKEYLAAEPGHWYSQFILWLIRHQQMSNTLYITATALELSFLAAFFTRKYDRVLFAMFCLFLVMDYLVMRIPYFEMLPAALPLLFSHKKLSVGI